MRGEVRYVFDTKVLISLSRYNGAARMRIYLMPRAGNFQSFFVRLRCDRVLINLLQPKQKSHYIITLHQ